MTKQTPKPLGNGYYQLENVIDVRTGKIHTVVQFKHLSDMKYFDSADPDVAIEKDYVSDTQAMNEINALLNE